MNIKNLISEITLQFPIDPIPAVLFSTESRFISQEDIPASIQLQLIGKAWCDIGLEAWAMMGVPIDLARDYLTPEAFAYYLPSLIVGGLSCNTYLLDIVEAIAPPEKKSTSTMIWWEMLAANVSPSQKRCIMQFLVFAEDSLGARSIETKNPAVEQARLFWSRNYVA